jgi:Zn finger protein HypA/HybF involved in hydrogenase expression
MHEMSLALEVCDITQRAIGDRSPAQVVEVVLDIGDDAGIEPSNLEFCLSALLSAPPFHAARPILRRQPGDELRVAHIEVDECP